jgi:hypothetical protein
LAHPPESFVRVVATSDGAEQRLLDVGRLHEGARAQDGDDVGTAEIAVVGRLALELAPQRGDVVELGDALAVRPEHAVIIQTAQIGTKRDGSEGDMPASEGQRRRLRLGAAALSFEQLVGVQPCQPGFERGDDIAAPRRGGAVLIDIKLDQEVEGRRIRIEPFPAASVTTTGHLMIAPRPSVSSNGGDRADDRFHARGRREPHDRNGDEAIAAICRGRRRGHRDRFRPVAGALA